MPVCKACGAISESKYCPDCGQSMLVKRLSLPELLHEAFHFFTHVEHGFLYTLKGLVLSPGTVQKQYVEGFRAKHQKPFSMFFLSATLSALMYYWIYTAVITYLHTGSAEEAEFFHKHFVLLHVCLLPLYALITYLCFKKGGFNYGEIAVYQLYTFSFIFLLIAFIQLFKFINPHLETRYIELPCVMAYILATNLRFFAGLKRNTVILLSLLSVILIFFTASFIQDRVQAFLDPLSP